MAKVKLDRKAAGLRSARLPRLRTATGLTAAVSKLHHDDYMGRAGLFCASRSTDQGGDHARICAPQ